MLPILVRTLIYPAHEALLRRPTFPYLRQLEASQQLDPQAMQALQMEKLRRLLRQAQQHSPWYRRQMDEAGIDPASDQPMDRTALARLPTLDKETIRRHSEEMLWRGVPGGAQPYNTGGSSGEPLRFFFGRWRQASDAAGRMRARRWWGVEPGDREIYLWGAPVELNKTDRIKTLRDRLFNQLVLNAFEMTPAHMDEYIDVLHAYRPRCLYGYASSVALLASHARARGRDLRVPGLQVVCTTGEPLYPHQRELIEATYGAPAANEFGSRDIGFSAHEAPGGHMLLMNESILLEVLDPQGQPVADGEPGEAVITGLCSEAQPFIRYRTGDIVRLSPDPDPQHPGLSVLVEIAGRSTDFVLRGDGAILHALAVIYEIRGKPGVAEFKFIQHELRRCEVQIVSGPGWSEDTAQAIEQDLHARLGDDVRIEIHTQAQIPVEASGKHRYVVSHVALPESLSPEL